MHNNNLLQQTTPHSIESEISDSYIAYAMSVIISRALPDTRDGFKPVLRRILYAMYEMKLFHNAKFKKSAAVVWEVLWKYHPHWDSSVYDAMVRLAQPFSLRYPLVDWQGNFGSIDGDGAAAMRYTEARLTKIAEVMLADIEQNTVDWRDNYDNSRQEPVMLPTRFPNHLCNGTMGIAVGMATNMAPHNLTEIIDAILLLIHHPESTIDDVMNIIKGPDFPTWWIIYDSVSIKEVYSKWRWSIVIRWKVHIEEIKWSKVIVIDEIPYQVNKSSLVSSIAQLVIDKKVDGIADLRDESNKNNIRITITLRKWVNHQDVLTQIYKYTDLQTSFNLNNVSLIDQGAQPKTMNIMELLWEFIHFRRQVVYKRSEFQLHKAKERLHILEWLKKAIDHLDEVIATIRWSQTKSDAKIALMSNFDFSDPQAEYILMMRLQSLVGLEIQKVLDEIKEKNDLITYLEWILADSKKLDEVVVQEMEEVKKDFGDARRTELSEDLSVFELNASIKKLKMIEERRKEDVILWIGNDYSVKILYQSRINSIPEESLDIIYTHNQDRLIVITDKGELVIERLKDFGSHQMKQKWIDLKEKYDLKGNVVFVSSMLHDYNYLTFLTDHNSIKKIKKELLESFKKFPTICMGLKDGEKLISVQPVREGDKIWILSQQWKFSLFEEKHIRPSGKTAWWVKAIELPSGDKVANMFLYKDEPFIMIYSSTKAKLLSKEDLMFSKHQFAKRGGKTLQVAQLDPGEYLKWAISIVEWAIRMRLENKSIITKHSNDLYLDIPESPLETLTSSPIDMIYRPREEKEENKKWKQEKWTSSQEEKSDSNDNLFESNQDKSSS